MGFFRHEISYFVGWLWEVEQYVDRNDGMGFYVLCMRVGPTAIFRFCTILGVLEMQLLTDGYVFSNIFGKPPACRKLSLTVLCTSKMLFVLLIF